MLLRPLGSILGQLRPVTRNFQANRLAHHSPAREQASSEAACEDPSTCYQAILASLASLLDPSYSLGMGGVCCAAPIRKGSASGHVLTRTSNMRNDETPLPLSTNRLLAPQQQHRSSSSENKTGVGPDESRNVWCSIWIWRSAIRDIGRNRTCMRGDDGTVRLCDIGRKRGFASDAGGSIGRCW